MASVGALLDQITFEIPLKEALQYPKGKEKWTRADIKVRWCGQEGRERQEGGLGWWLKEWDMPDARRKERGERKGRGRANDPLRLHTHTYTQMNFYSHNFT